MDPLDDEIEREPPVALALVLGGDHEAPDEVLLLLEVLGEHDEADRNLGRIHRTEPCLRLEVRLGDRDGVRRDEVTLLGTACEIANRPHGL